MAGVRIRTVAELTGHKTIRMTMRYAHLAPQHKLEGVERLAAKQAPQIEPSVTPQRAPAVQARGQRRLCLYTKSLFLCYFEVLRGA